MMSISELLQRPAAFPGAMVIHFTLEPMRSHAEGYTLLYTLSERERQVVKDFNLPRQ